MWDVYKIKSNWVSSCLYAINNDSEGAPSEQDNNLALVRAADKMTRNRFFDESHY